MQIEDAKSLEHAVIFLRDGIISFESIIFEVNTAEVSLEIWKLDANLPPSQKIGPINCKTIPYIKWRMRFRDVKACDIHLLESHNRSNCFSLSSIEWDQCGTVTINTYDGLSVAIQVTQLLAELVPAESPDI